MNRHHTYQVHNWALHRLKTREFQCIICEKPSNGSKVFCEDDYKVWISTPAGEDYAEWALQQRVALLLRYLARRLQVVAENETV